MFLKKKTKKKPNRECIEVGFPLKKKKKKSTFSS